MGYKSAHFQLFADQPAPDWQPPPPLLPRKGSTPPYARYLPPRAKGTPNLHPVDPSTEYPEDRPQHT